MIVRDDDLALLREIPDPLSDVGVQRPSDVRLPARRPTRKDVLRTRRMALAIGATWLVAPLLVAGIRPDVAAVPPGYWIGLGALPLVAGLICVAAAVSRGRLGLGQRVAVLAALASVAPAAYVVGGYVSSPPYPGAPLADFEHGALCLNIALAWTLLPLLSAGIALRRSFAGNAVLRSAAVGAGAGLIVAVTSTLRCPLSGALHVAFSHGGAIVLTAVLGALVLSRVTRA